MSIDDLFNQALGSQLKALAFRQKAFCWNRSRIPLIDVLTVQVSKGSTSADLQFAINIGVFVPRFYEMVWTQPAVGFINEADCVIRKRIGPESGGEWWRFSSGSDNLAEVCADLKHQVTENALPFYDGISSIEDIYKELYNLGDWKQQYWLTQLYFAIAAALIGEGRMSSDILSSISQRKNGALMKKAQKISRSLERLYGS